MNDRYVDVVIRGILAPPAQIERWFKVEAAWLAARFQIEIETPMDYVDLSLRSSMHEARHGHDVLGFIQAVADKWSDQEWATRWFHYGLTSSDVVDTAESLMIGDLENVLGTRLMEVHDQLMRLMANADGYVWTTSHGRQAEPILHHGQYVIWARRVFDAMSQLLAAAVDNREGRFRGPAGSDGRPTKAEEVACRRLGLDVATASFQAMNRETRATWHQAVAQALAVIDALAMHVKRWICEEREGFMQLEWGTDGVPSSSMPHKRNPTTLEQIHGLSTLFTSMQAASLHLVPMHDEREIAHSSADRILHESGANWLAHSCNQLVRVLRDCSVVPGLPTRPVSSFASMHNLISNGMSRQEATDEVRKATNGS